MSTQIVLLEIGCSDRRDAVIEREHDCRTHQHAQVDLVDGLPIIEEVPRCIYMCACVRAEMNAGHIRPGAARNSLLELDGNLRISRVDESTGSDGN
jgi:hypothetical protein